MQLTHIANPVRVTAVRILEVTRQELWPLMGYQLREQLFQATQPAQAPQ